MIKQKGKNNLIEPISEIGLYFVNHEYVNEKKINSLERKTLLKMINNILLQKLITTLHQ